MERNFGLAGRVTARAISPPAGAECVGYPDRRPCVSRLPEIVRLCEAAQPDDYDSDVAGLWGRHHGRDHSTAAAPEAALPAARCRVVRFLVKKKGPPRRPFKGQRKKELPSEYSHWRSADTRGSAGRSRVTIDHEFVGVVHVKVIDAGPCVASAIAKRSY